MSDVAILLSEKLFECALLKQQLAERDELILELGKVREFYADTNKWYGVYSDNVGEGSMLCADFDCDFMYSDQYYAQFIGGKLARTPLKNQALLDEIKEGRK